MKPGQTNRDASNSWGWYRANLTSIQSEHWGISDFSSQELQCIFSSFSLMSMLIGNCLWCWSITAFRQEVFRNNWWFTALYISIQIKHPFWTFLMHCLSWSVGLSCLSAIRGNIADWEVFPIELNQVTSKCWIRKWETCRRKWCTHFRGAKILTSSSCSSK